MRTLAQTFSVFLFLFAGLRAYCTDVVQYEKFEVSPIYSSSSLVDSKNPFNKQEVILKAVITAPDGRTIEVHGFYNKNFSVRDYLTNKNPEWPYLNAQKVTAVVGSADYWTVRFTPELVGTYTYTIEFYLPEEDSTISVSSSSFSCVPSSNPKAGFVRMVNNDYFAYSDGSGFIPIGINLYSYPGWNAYQPKVNFFEMYFEQLSAHGCNVIHMSLDVKMSALGLVGWDSESGTFILDRFSLSDAYVLDKIVEAAEDNDIRIQFRLFSHENFSHKIDCPDADHPIYFAWNENNVWNVNAERVTVPGDKCIRTPNGIVNPIGIINTREEFFTDDDAFDQQANLVQYIIDRWGYSPAVFAWEILAEADHFLLDTIGLNTLIAWHRDIADLIRDKDVYGRAVTTSFGGKEADHFDESPYDDIFDYLDFTQFHRYFAQFSGESIIAEKYLFDHYFNAHKDHFRKPVLLSESGNFGDWDKIKVEVFYEDYDSHGYAYHELLWTTIFEGGFGSYLDWRWRAFIDRRDPAMGPTDYMEHLGALSDYLENIDVLGKQSQISYRINSTETDNLNIYYINDPDAEKLYGLAQDEGFVLNRLIDYSDPDNPVLDPYLTNLDENLMPDRLSQTNTFELPVSNGQYIISWYDTETGDLVKEEYATINNGTIELRIPSELLGSKFGDAAFILTKSNYGWEESKLVPSSTNTVLPHTELKIGNGKLRYVRELDSKIHTMYIPTASGDIWSDDWVHPSSGSLKYSSSTCHGYDIVPENSEIFFANAYGGNINRLYWNIDQYVLTFGANGNEKASLNTELHVNNNIVYYASTDGTLHMMYKLNDVWRYDYLNPSAPKLKDGTGFVVAAAGTIYYVGADNYLYKIYYNYATSSWLWEPTVTATNSAARSDSRMGYANGKVYYVQNSDRLHVLYKNNGVWDFDWLNRNAPNVLSGTGFDVTYDGSTRIYYVGDDNNIYKSYWTSEDRWVWQQFNIANSSSGGAKSNSDVVYMDDQIFYVGKNDGSIHRLQCVHSVPFYDVNTTIGKGNNWGVNGTDGRDVAYKFYISETTAITATTSHPETTIANSKLQIFNSSFNSVKYQYIGAPTSGVSLNATLSPGYYYIVVDGYAAGDFKLTVNPGFAKSADIIEDESISIENEGKNSSYLCSEEIRIFPNPVQESLTVELVGNENSEFDFELYDLKGQLLLNRKSEGNSLNINCSALPKGVYVSKIKTQSATYYRKIVLQN
ncbi:MAG: T9SS type A sorting domain-containing protein [Bacteroidales bacterium]|nr:T9SS type A sorting domain-containing protein [Bacteroidales bacterium]